MSSDAKRRKIDDLSSTFEEDVLDEVSLTPEQELEYATITPDDSESEARGSEVKFPGSVNQGLTDYYSSEAKETPRGYALQVPVSSHDKFLRFLRDNSTSGWNYSNAEDVYKYLNASLHIVGPNHILGIYELGDSVNLTVDSILNRLEHQSVIPAWSAVPKEMERFLDVFEGFENLANCLNEPSQASPLVLKFQRRLGAAQTLCEDKKFDKWYQLFHNFTRRLLEDIGNCKEILSKKYVKLLIEMFADVHGLFIYLDVDELNLYVPLGRGKSKTICVEPAMILQSPHIFLVGEVKRFGCHGNTHEKTHGKIHEFYRGSIPKSSPSQNDKHLGGKEDPLPGCGTITEKGQESLEKRNVHVFPCRSLGSRERYKVRNYLPQLLGQILSAMHLNQRRFNLGSSIENAMLGFAVEGFKLRFVKLVLHDIQCKKQPTVGGLFSGEYYESHVYLTQEFNLFKKSHLRMFFKTILAIFAECGM